MEALSVLPGETKSKLDVFFFFIDTSFWTPLPVCFELRCFFDAASLNVNFGTPQVVRSPAGWWALRDASPTANAAVRWVDCTSRPVFSASWQILRSDSVSGHEGSRLSPGHWAFLDESLVKSGAYVFMLWGCLRVVSLVLLTLAPACFCLCFFLFCLVCEKTLTRLYSRGFTQMIWTEDRRLLPFKMNIFVPIYWI